MRESGGRRSADCNAVRRHMCGVVGRGIRGSDDQGQSRTGGPTADAFQCGRHRPDRPAWPRPSAAPARCAGAAATCPQGADGRGSGDGSSLAACGEEKWPEAAVASSAHDGLRRWVRAGPHAHGAPAVSVSWESPAPEQAKGWTRKNTMVGRRPGRNGPLPTSSVSGCKHSSAAVDRATGDA